MLNILLLEDQPAVRDVMVEVIHELDVPTNIGCAESLKQARELFKEHSWHGMVADLSLGDGQSLDLVSELREQGNDLPIIMVSGFLSPDKSRKAGRLGIKHVLHKPFDPDVLLQKLHSLFDMAATRPEANPPTSQHNKLLPRLFEMDRHLGLLFRMINEIPQSKDVVQICSSALSLALDMAHANRGFIALFERVQESLIMVAHQEVGGPDDVHAVAPSCRLAATPFAPLVSGEEEFINMLSGQVEHGPVCWPTVSADDYIAIPMRLQGTPMGVICLMDCQTKGELSDQLKHILGLLVMQLDTLLDNCAVHASLDKSMKETLIALVRSLEARDKYTKDHSSRVSKLSVLFAKRLGLDEEALTLVRTGGLLHDIGKTGVPDSVLLKPGRFTDREYAIIKTHPAIGDSILRNMDTLVRERQIVRHHHERMDGFGYPDKLKGDQIPLTARIVCVADAIDAMTTHRVYRQARPLSFCVEQLRKNAGTQFDTQVVEVAIAAIEEGLVDTQAIYDDEEDFGNVLPAFLPAFAKM